MLRRFLSIIPVLSLVIASHAAASEPSIGLSGQAKFDQTVFLKKNIEDQQFPTSANLRKLELTVAGPLDPNWSMKIDIGLEKGVPELGLAFLTYTGFSDNLSVYLGQIPPPFGYEATGSSKWTAFMERPMVVTAFAPAIGPGVSVSHHYEWFTFQTAVKGPTYSAFKAPENADRGDDRFGWAVRGAIVPMNSDETTLSFDGHFLAQDLSKDVTFKAPREIFARRNAVLVSTTLPGAAPLAANLFTVYGGGMAAKYKNTAFQGEWVGASVNRTDSDTRLAFSGWYAQIDHFLTGESRPFDQQTIAFKNISGFNFADTGAWQVAARYSTIDMNDGEFQGGKQNNIGVGLSWYPTRAIRVSANYAYEDIYPSASRPAYNLHTLGMRFQTVW